MGAVAYYLLILPLSWLPLPVLYVFTDFFYLLIIAFVPYRKKVIMGNLERSFPEYSPTQLKRTQRTFYRHFTDLLAEGIKNLSISEASIRRRMTVKNPEVMDQLYAKGRHVILVSGHYNNWEWLVSSQPLQFKHKAVGIGMPMSSSFWDQKINTRRARFGMQVVHSKNYKEALAQVKAPTAVLVLSDQSPGNSLKSYWMEFLNQPTAVLFGAEMMAHELDYAVVGFITRKTGRGRYQLELQLITEDPKRMPWGSITEAHTRMLEEEIRKQPAYWLWSHKRWKREVPENLEELKQQQRAQFEAKYPPL